MGRPINQIIDGLYVSNITYAVTEDTSEFDRVVTVCQDNIEDNVGCRYSHYKMADGEPQGHNPGDCSFELFEQAADEVAVALADGETVLVHCHAGQSRSVSVCMAAVAALTDSSFAHAREVVEDARPQAQPNALLLEHARKYAQRMTGEQTYEERAE